MSKYNTLYYLAIGYCVMFALTWMLYMNIQAAQYVSLALYYDSVADELIAQNQTEYAAHFCLMAEAFCRLYSGMRGELTVAWGGSDVQGVSRREYDSACDPIYGAVGKNCTIITSEIMLNYIESIDSMDPNEVPDVFKG